MDGTIFHRLGLFACTIAKINAQPTLTRKEYVFAFVAISSLFLFLFAPALLAKFYVVEDHLLLTGQSWGISGWVSRITGDTQYFQRVRPAYWLYVAMGGKIFGTNPHFWHAAAILWGVLTCYLFYIALRKIGADMASSFIFVLLLVIGTQNWIWLNLIPAETIGMLLTAVAVCAITIASQRSQVGRWDVLALSAMVFAGLVKESFVILIPAMLLLRWTCQMCFNDQTWRESLRALRAPLMAGLVIFVVMIVIIIIALRLNPSGYAANASGLSMTSFDPRRWLQKIASFGLNSQLLLATGTWIGLLLYRKANRIYLLAIAVILGAWLIPQLILYNNYFQERYLFPAVVGIAAAIAFSLTILWRSRYLWPLGIVGAVLLLPVFSNGVKSTTTTVGLFTAETRAANQMVEFVAQTVPADQVILMAGDSGTDYGFEATYSLPIYLKMAGSKSPFYLWPIVSKGARSAMHISASKNNTAFRYPDTLLPCDVGAIIIVDKWIPAFDSKPLAQWLGDTAWREINFTEPYYSFSFREFRYLKAGEVNHKILLSTSASGVPSARPLIVVDHSLMGVVHASPMLDSPPWGLERDYAGPGSIVWIGQGDGEGLGWVLSSTRALVVNIDLEVVPGPSRSDYRRTVAFSLDNRAGQQTQRKVFEGGQWKFNVKLQPGANHFRLKLLDEATVSIQPNGDTRHLLALLRRMKVSKKEIKESTGY